jgi:hypothetical protein
MMAKLTGTQLIVLSSAAVNNDGAAIVPERLNKAAALKVGSSLVARKLMRETRAKPGMAIWREDEEGRGLSLVILRAGRDAIGIEEKDKHAEPCKGAGATSKARGKAGATLAASRAATLQAEAVQVCTDDAPCGYSLPREGSKQALIITMLQKAKGATLEALIEATGWLPHTTRAALTGLRKRGFTIERSKGEAGPIYRIISSGSTSSSKSAA